MSPGEVATILFSVFIVLVVLRVPVAFPPGLACVPVFILPSGIKLAGNPEPVQFKLIPTNPSP